MLTVFWVIKEARKLYQVNFKQNWDPFFNFMPHPE